MTKIIVTIIAATVPIGMVLVRDFVGGDYSVALFFGAVCGLMAWLAPQWGDKHDPAIAREVLAIISGEAEASSPANIDKLVRFFMQRGGG